MKYIIIASVGILTVFIGINLSRKYKNRVETIEDFLSFINLVDTKVEYSVPITQIINDYISTHNNSEFFKDVLRLKDDGMSLGEAWLKVCSDRKKEYFGADIKLINDFGTMLGNSDAHNQHELCCMYKILFRENLDIAKSESNSKGRLFVRLGIFGALFITVVFI